MASGIFRLAAACNSLDTVILKFQADIDCSRFHFTNQFYRCLVERRAIAVRVLVGSHTPGSADGDGVAASLHLPQSICQPSAHTLLLADRQNGRIRKYDLKTGVVHLIVQSVTRSFIQYSLLCSPTRRHTKYGGRRRSER